MCFCQLFASLYAATEAVVCVNWLSHISQFSKLLKNIVHHLHYLLDNCINSSKLSFFKKHQQQNPQTKTHQTKLWEILKMQCQLRMCLAGDEWIISVQHCGRCVPRCIAVCLWLLSLPCPDSRPCDERKKCLHAMPAVGPALLIQFPLKIQPSWLRYFKFFFPPRAGQRQHFVCVFPAVKSASEEDWAKPSVCAVEGIMECSHENLCCQSSDLWQGKRTVYLLWIISKGIRYSTVPSSWICTSASFLTPRTAEEI